MTLTPKATQIHAQINTETTKLGDLRKIAKEVKKDHDLAMELWSTGAFYSRQLAVLIMDKKQLSPEVVDQLIADLDENNLDERTRIADWLMANQLAKDKKTIALMESWENSPSAIQRRLFWYYQARLRWTGKIPYDNASELLASIEKKMAKAEPEVQWAMNFAAGQIGVFDTDYRAKCIEIGERMGLYKDEVVPKNCTPNYLPEFIRIEVGKRNK